MGGANWSWMVKNNVIWEWKWNSFIDYEGGAKNENKWKKLAEFGTDFI